MADHLSKWWAVRTLVDEPLDLIWTLRLRLVSNTGASFSVGEGFGPVIGVIALAVVGALLWSGRTVETRTGAVGLGMVLGGALGNVLDRAFRAGDGLMAGAVVDWIDLQWWPVFNLADAGVVVGAVVLVISAGSQERAGSDADELLSIPQVPETRVPDAAGALPESGRGSGNAR